jgi:3-oxoacyl-[acyl-carrier protein] reductase
VVADPDAGALEAALTELSRPGPPATGFVAELGTEAGLAALWNAALGALEQVDVLVIAGPPFPRRALAEISDEEWEDILEAGLGGAFRSVRAGLRHMLARGSGSIVCIRSGLAWAPESDCAAQSAVEAGGLALCRTAAIEAAATGVRVNAVVASAGAEPDEVASVVAFLASQRASYVTGESVAVGLGHP